MNHFIKGLGVPFRSRLIWTFFLWFLLAMTVTLVGTVGVVVLTTYSDIEKTATRMVQREAYLWRNITGRLLDAGLTEEEFREVFAPLMEREPFFASIWDENGTIRLHLSPPGEPDEPFLVPADVRRRIDAGEEYIDWNPGSIKVGLPVQKKGGGQGGVYVVIDHDNKGHENIEHPNRFWIGLSAVLVIGFLLCWPLAVRLARPLRRAAEAADALGRGDLTARIDLGKGRGWHGRRVHEHGPKGEIGLLATSFNTMAENLQRLVGGHKQLLADISHELRTPLARLEVALELARQEDGKQPGYLDVIARQAARMEDMIGELLTYSRLEMAPCQLQREPTTPGELMTEAVTLHREEAAENSVTCIVTGTALESRIDVDQRMVLRAVENVLRNAIGHAPSGSEVVLRAEAKEGGIALSVVDAGAGVDPENLERIFQPFFRADAARNPNQGGIGLGLAIARRCLEAHGGTARAESAPGRKGLRIVLWLPAAPQNEV